MDTERAIQAGVMWTLVTGIQSFIKDRWKQEPTAVVIFTGGDAEVSLFSSIYSTYSLCLVCGVLCPTVPHVSLLEAQRSFGGLAKFGLHDICCAL